MVSWLTFVLLGSLVAQELPAGLAPRQPPVLQLEVSGLLLDPSDQIPERLSQVGVYTDLQAQTAAPGLIPYSVNSPLWSDGAIKTRLIALPGSETIRFSADSPWGFPAGTVLVKSFYFQFEDENPGSRRIIETRLLVKNTANAAWSGFSYEWNEEGSDATLLEASLAKTFVIRDTAGVEREQGYYYPSRFECRMCHLPLVDYVLGVNTAQLNGDYDYGGVVDSQLQALNAIGVFDRDIEGDADDFPRLVDPQGVDSLEARARSYLAVNCGHCHRPGSIGRSAMDLRVDVPTYATHTIGAGPVIPGSGDGSRLLLPGDPARSVLYQRMLAKDESRMPPLASSVVDEQGARLVREWIVHLGGVCDFNNDGSVDLSDLMLFADVFAQQTETSSFDLNGDGRIDFFDLFIFGDFLTAAH